MESTLIVTLRQITKENLNDILDLKVTSEQENFIASNSVSIAQAHFYPELSWFQAIYSDEIPIGFVLIVDDPVRSYYKLWRFMIDKRFQKCGFGLHALKLVIKYVKTRPGAKVFLTSCVSGEGSPAEFYEKGGFKYTGKVDEDGELIMQYEL